MHHVKGFTILLILTRGPRGRIIMHLAKQNDLLKPFPLSIHLRSTSSWTRRLELHQEDPQLIVETRVVLPKDLPYATLLDQQLAVLTTLLTAEQSTHCNNSYNT